MPRLVISKVYCLQNFLPETSKHNRQKQPETDFQFKVQGSYHLYLNKFKTSLNCLQLKVEPPDRIHQPTNSCNTALQPMAMQTLQHLVPSVLHSQDCTQYIQMASTSAQLLCSSQTHVKQFYVYSPCHVHKYESYVYRILLTLVNIKPQKYLIS